MNRQAIEQQLAKTLNFIEDELRAEIADLENAGDRARTTIDTQARRELAELEELAVDYPQLTGPLDVVERFREELSVEIAAFENMGDKLRYTVETQLPRALDRLKEAVATLPDTDEPPPPVDPDPPAEPLPGPAPTPKGVWIKTADVPRIEPNFDRSQFIFNKEQRESFADRDGRDADGGDTAAFRLHAGPSHINWTDAMFAPGEKSPHPHLWAGNDTYGAFSTYESLRLTGHSTSEGWFINRSVYGGAPLLATDPDGQHWVLVPDHLIVYYKHEHPGHKFWRENPHAVRSSIPRGLQMVSGVHHYDRSEWPREHVAPVQYKAGGYKGLDLDKALAEWLSAGGNLIVSSNMPNLWDGEHSKSPNNKDHVSYMRHRRHEPLVPESHRFVMPTITQNYSYSLPPGLDIKRLFVASDPADANVFGIEFPPGHTGHFYFWDAWDDEARELITSLTHANNYSYSNGRYGPRPETIDPATRNAEGRGVGIGPALKWRDESAYVPTNPVRLEDVPIW
jgi:hypothetical protein